MRCAYPPRRPDSSGSTTPKPNASPASGTPRTRSEPDAPRIALTASLAGAHGALTMKAWLLWVGRIAFVFFALFAVSVGDILESIFFLVVGLMTESTLGLGKKNDGPSGLLVRR